MAIQVTNEDIVYEDRNPQNNDFKLDKSRIKDPNWPISLREAVRDEKRSRLSQQPQAMRMRVGDRETEINLLAYTCRMFRLTAHAVRLVYPARMCSVHMATSVKPKCTHTHNEPPRITTAMIQFFGNKITCAIWLNMSTATNPNQSMCPLTRRFDCVVSVLAVHSREFPRDRYWQQNRSQRFIQSNNVSNRWLAAGCPRANQCRLIYCMWHTICQSSVTSGEFFNRKSNKSSIEFPK